MQITICGGGNAAHALAGLIASRREYTVNVYAPYGDEAEQWRKGIEARGGIALVSHDGSTQMGRPERVSGNPDDVVPGSRVVLLSLPAFAHQTTFGDIAPYVEEGAWVGALPARGGLDWCGSSLLRFEGKSVVVFGLQTLPWACRIREYGQEVAILGTKTEVDLAAWPSHYVVEVAELLSDLVRVPMRPISSFLSLTLANTGQLIHPGVMYGLFRDWDGQPYAEAPLFYQGVDASTADILQQLSDEIQSLRALLEERYPGLDLSAVQPLHDWLQRAYGEEIDDCSSLQICFVTNRGYAGLRAPMRASDEGLVPDYHSRYLSEDVPYGLLVARGIAELADLPTPMIDKVITWAQAHMGREYLVDGKLQECNPSISRAPQCYGLRSLDDIACIA